MGGNFLPVCQRKCKCLVKHGGADLWVGNKSLKICSQQQCFQPLPAAVPIKTVTFIDLCLFCFKSQSQVLLRPSEPQTHGCKYLKYPLGLLQAFFFCSYINWMRLGCHLPFTRNTKELTLQLFFWVNCSALIMLSVVFLLRTAGLEQSMWDSVRIWENSLSTVAGENWLSRGAKFPCQSHK